MSSRGIASCGGAGFGMAGEAREAWTGIVRLGRQGLSRWGGVGWGFAGQGSAGKVS